MSQRLPADPVERLISFFRNNQACAHKVMHQFVALDRPLLLRSEILDAFELLCESDDEGERVQDAITRLSLIHI